MLKSYFTIALRNVAKEKGYSFIKIFGLAASMIIYLMWRKIFRSRGFTATTRPQTLISLVSTN